MAALHGRSALSLEGRDSSSFTEAVGFSAPIKISAGVADGPGNKAEEVPQRIEPAKTDRARIACHGPSHHHRLDHSVQTCKCEQADSELPVTERGCGDESENSEGQGVGEASPRMSGGSRIACALHPAKLIAKGANQRAGGEHVAHDVVRKNDLVILGPDAISQFEIVGVVVSDGRNATDRVDRVAPHGHSRTEGETHSFEHVRDDYT